jgi:hypothetical protein
MKIQLTGELHPELISIGIKSGDIVDAYKDPVSKVGGMHFSKYFNGSIRECSIWPDNYVLIDNNQTKKCL